ncbi:BRCA1-A complex subunit Abraxas 1 [Patella vulgata]|uniref:BRCA1-A complex subunit Abraxas 1 n=1 Tax=Patella vulgata TaxID=6465 RepID=UPI00217F3BA5|nr:BRCA1-A complex subunit Abraxas 1 [Patella vulgata]
MAANVNGVTLASLFYHHQNSPNDEEGFLFGKVIKRVQDTISDTEITNSQVETIVYIIDFQPWVKDICIYGSNGKVDPGMFASVLNGREQEVIGWYGCRRNSTMRISMKESNIHQSLISTLLLEQPENFLFLMSSATAANNLSTLSYDHAFYRYKNRQFDRIPVTVVNLGDTTHTQYKSQSQLSVSDRPDSLQNSLASFRNRFESSSGDMMQVKNIQELSDSLHKKLMSISRLVTESESSLSSLEKEVEDLTWQLEEETRKKTETEILPCENVPSSVVELELSDTDADSELDISPKKQTFVKNTQQQTSLSKSIPMDIVSNAYSIKLHELDNQVLDLDKPHNSKDSKSISNSSFDDTWLDISIHTNTTTATLPTSNTEIKAVEAISSEQSKTSGTDVKTITNRTRASKTKPTNTSQSKDPFSFVSTIMDKEIKNPDSEGSDQSGPIKSTRAPTVHKDSSLKNEGLTTVSSLKLKEGRRAGSAERQTRQVKGAKSGISSTEIKKDTQTDAKIAQAKTQRAKMRTEKAQSRRSLSRESTGKQESVPCEQNKKSKLKTGNEIKPNTTTGTCKTDNVRETRNKGLKTKCQTQNVSSNGDATSSDKTDSIIIDDDIQPSSSPIF